MKKLTRLLFTVLLAGTVQIAGAVNYSATHLLLVFRGTNGSGKNVEFDIGSVTNLLNQPAGVPIPISYNTNLVVTNFGGTLSNVSFAVVGATALSDPTPRLWLSSADLVHVPTDVTGSRFSTLRGKIDAVGVAATAIAPGAGVPLVISPSAVNSYAYIVSGGSGSAISTLGGDSAFAVEGFNPPATNDLYELVPSTATPKPPAIKIGRFTIDASGNVSLTPSAVTPVITSLLADQTVQTGDAVTFSITADGATSYQWRKDGFDIPGATTTTLVVTNDAHLAVADGVYSVVLSNSVYGTSATGSATLTVVCPTITVDPVTLPGSARGLSYANTITASGGQSPYTFAVTSGTLPIGLTLNSSNGVLSGKTTVYGSNTFTVTATDPYTCTAARTYTIIVVTNDFPDVAGTFYGLFNDTNAPAHPSSGWIKLKVTNKLKFSGKMYLEGESVSIGGEFGLAGVGTLKKPATRKGLINVPVTVVLNLPVDFTTNEATVMTGTVSNSSWSASLVAVKDRFNFTNNPATNWVGAYTMILPGATNAANRPAGDGYALLSIATNGLAKAKGYYGDIEKLKPVIGPIVSNGFLPFYQPLYPSSRLAVDPPIGNVKSYNGSVFGWLAITNGQVAGLAWNKTGWTNGFYDVGFTNFWGESYWPQPPWWPYPWWPPYNVIPLPPPDPGIPQQMSPFVSPATGTRIIDITNGLASLFEGNLSLVTNSFLLSTNSKFGPTTLSNGTVKLSFTTKGELKGKFIHPATGLQTKIQGAVLQNQDIAGGSFKGTNQTGNILLEGTP